MKKALALLLALLLLAPLARGESVLDAPAIRLADGQELPRLRHLASFKDQGYTSSLQVQGDRVLLTRTFYEKEPVQVLDLLSLQDGRRIARVELDRGAFEGAWQAGFLKDGSIFSLREGRQELLLFDRELGQKQRQPLPELDYDTQARVDKQGGGLFGASQQPELWRFDFTSGQRAQFPSGLPGEWMFMDFLDRQDKGPEAILMDRNGLAIHFAPESTSGIKLSPLPPGFDWFSGGAVFMTYKNRALWGSLPFDGQLTDIGIWQEFEYPMAQNGPLLLTGRLYPDAVFRLYDLHRGALLDTLTLPIKDSTLAIDQVEFVGEKQALLSVNDVETGAYALYLWDFDNQKPEDTTGIRRVAFQQIRAETDQHAAAIAQKHGITLNIRDRGARFASEVYLGTPFDHELVLAYALDQVDRFFSSLPVGMVRELLVPPYRRLALYLSGPIRPKTNSGISSAAGLCSDHGTERYIALDTQDVGLLTNFAHEFMHLLEDRLWLLEEGNTPGILSAWDHLTTGSLPDRGYFYAYHDEQGREWADMQYTADDHAPGDDPHQVWFIDAYARTFPMEDRARVFEQLYAGSPYAKSLFTLPNLRRKAQALNAAIRQAFPSVNRAQSAPWEKLVSPLPYPQALEAVLKER